MDSDSDSSDYGILNQALPIPAVPRNYKPNAAPTSAEEYIQHVVWVSGLHPYYILKSVYVW